MSWSKPTRRAFFLASAAALAACGFDPVYAPAGAGGKLRNAIRVKDPETPVDFTFNTHIAERLGEGSDYDLDYQINIGVVSQAITRDEITTRYSLNGTAEFTLTDSAGEVVLESRVSSFTAYSTTGTAIATLSAERDARNRLARMLADQVVTQLLARIP